jgi:hypothetical protein
MNVFDEFYQIVDHVHSEGIEYALVGGVAVAFHTEPRFTKDIDLLIREADLKRLQNILEKAGYFQSAPPWTFRGSALTLHRFLKIQNTDEMVIDIIVAGDSEAMRIIDNALEAKSERWGAIKVAAKADLIRLKRKRNSKQDQADIERLTDEKP